MHKDTPHSPGEASPRRADWLPVGAAEIGAEPVDAASRDGKTQHLGSATSRGGNAQRPANAAARPRTAIDEAELAHIPSLDEWPDLGARELERRARVLADIRQRVVEHGPHRAVAAPERGRLFMPFAALKGYDDLVKCVEGE